MPGAAMPQSSHRQGTRIYLVGGFATALLFCAFLMGVLGLIYPTPPVPNNWLVVLFDVNLRPDSTHPSALQEVSALDVALMLLFGLAMIAEYQTHGPKVRIWAAVAAALPFLGVPVFLATATAGRSAVLLAGFISSILALRSSRGSAGAAITGLLASGLLLFVGDFGTAAFDPSSILAGAMGLGYLLWTIWLGLMSLGFFKRARLSRRPEDPAADLEKGRADSAA